MLRFKVAATQADRRKTKGNWIIKSQQRAIAKGECRFFSLPAELRNTIYGFVFTPGAIIKLCKLPRHGHHKEEQDSLTIRFDKSMGNYSRKSGSQTKWENSVSGIVLVNKQAHEEAIAYLYGSCTFTFCPAKSTWAFLHEVSKKNLECVRSISLYRETKAAPDADTDQAHEDLYKTDQSFAKLCLQLVHMLPNVTSLDITLKLNGTPEDVVPDFSVHHLTYGAKQLTRMNWLEPLAVFSSLRNLKDVRFHLHKPQVATLVRYFRDSGFEVMIPTPGGQILTSSQIRAFALDWAKWCAWLYRTMDKACQRLILRAEGDKVWEEHLEMLDSYLQWCQDPWSKPEKYHPVLSETAKA
ncbi:hypothetical protein LTR37_006950 [Vermiconidia calcicola]|uniref:Uncharacterized protein n=1 Tax=Vermiconidia calcicola TaxID=1690605 RepID=A0ACC3NEV1_9PEZI|nr:hypothetical protein LTR37_006950 [Vermiconidia calcicola]